MSPIREPEGWIRVFSRSRWWGSFRTGLVGSNLAGTTDGIRMVRTGRAFDVTGRVS
jgi:hypothetical protein